MGRRFWSCTIGREILELPQDVALKKLRNEHGCPIESLTTFSHCFKQARLLAGLNETRWPYRYSLRLQSLARAAEKCGRMDLVADYQKQQQELFAPITLMYIPRPNLVRDEWNREHADTSSAAGALVSMTPVVKQSRVPARPGSLERWLKKSLHVPPVDAFVSPTGVFDSDKWLDQLFLDNDALAQLLQPAPSLPDLCGGDDGGWEETVEAAGSV